MKSAAGFIFFTLAFIAAAGALTARLPDADPFAAPAPVNLRAFTATQAAEMKLRHAAAQGAPYDVGLFGSSRILSVGAPEMKTGACGVFNFALSGQSFRSSVDMLEHLLRAGAAPRTAVISVDHFELQMAANAEWLSWTGRIKTAVRDFIYTVETGAADTRILSQIIWRYIWTEKNLFRQQFEAMYLRRMIDGVFSAGPDFEAAEKSASAYRADGSLALSARAFGAVNPVARTRAQILPPVFQRDLDRLFATAARNDIKVIIYESPLHPESARVFEKTPSVFVINNRKRLKDACGAYAPRCRLADPAPAMTAAPDSWSDATHPPAAALGRWIAGEVRAASPECGG
ncbi:MAG: hypothetical protein ACYYKD_02720 [Rhodospirillales bacterium]